MQASLCAACPGRLLQPLGLMSDHYFLPSELFGLLAFWFVPPLLIALTVIYRSCAKRGIVGSHPLRVACALGLTILLSLALGLTVLILSPSFLSALSITSIKLGSYRLPVFPFSFVAVTLVSFVTAWWAIRVARPNPAIKRGAPQAALPLP